jgi:outer membrane protein OmpA-like peptidoglycan-associated protein
MLGRRVPHQRGNRDDGEKPFWISFADLMTAMMVLFLVAMCAALMQAKKETAKALEAQEAATRLQADLEKARRELEEEKRRRNLRRERREARISAFQEKVREIVVQYPGISFDAARNAINFGPRAHFESGRHDLSRDQVMTLRRFVPELLEKVHQELDPSDRWLKRIVVEGFTDDRGGYLYNLNLSLQRSQRVICGLLAKEWITYVSAPRPVPAPAVAGWPAGAGPGPSPLPPQFIPRAEKLDPLGDREEFLIRSLFFVGGYSSNSQKASREESRRIELRIEFFELDVDDAERAADLKPAIGEVGPCRLGAR